jgi:hypothetical protein
MRIVPEWLPTAAVFIALGCAAADDDSTEIDAPFSCDNLTDEEAGLFAHTFVAGASNSPGCGGACTYDFMKGLGAYWSRVVVKGYERVGKCVEYEPQALATGYMNVGTAPPDTTLSICLDAFFWYSDQELDRFRESVEEYLEELHSAAPNAALFVANIPESFISAFMGQSNPADYNAAIATALDAYPRYFLLDLNSGYTQVLKGKVEYDGEVVKLEDILINATHINAFGHQVVADQFILRLNEEYPGLHLETHGDLVIRD